MSAGQVFHVVRALQEAGVCGSALCLPVVASECLSCGLIDSPAILDCLRSLSVALDGATSPRPGGERGCAAQDVCIGAASLVASIHGKVVLPPGFVDSMFERLRKAAANPVNRTGMERGSRVVSFLALSSLIGCPLLGIGEFVPRYNFEEHTLHYTDMKYFCRFFGYRDFLFDLHVAF